MTPRIVQEPLGDDVYRIAPEGRLDAVTVPAFEAMLTEHLNAGRSRLVIDLSGVTYISSSGLRALLSVRRRARSDGGDVVLCNMLPRVREIFEMVGFVSLFRIAPSVQEAARTFTDGVSVKP